MTHDTDTRLKAVGQTSTDHTITPLKGSSRRPDGAQADLMNPRHYPVEATCLDCGEPVRCEMFVNVAADPDGGWFHIERFTLSAGTA